MSLSTTASLEPTLDAAERKRKAAAARRRRRKALAARYRKRNMQEKQKRLCEERQHEQSPRSVSQSRVFLGPPLSGLSKDEDDDDEDAEEKEPSLNPTSSEGDDANSDANSSDTGSSTQAVAGDESLNTSVYSTPIWPRSASQEPPPPQISCDANSQNSPTKRIEATVDGLSQVGGLWKQQDIVAIPTECTYEACMVLRASPLSSPPCNQELNQPTQTTIENPLMVSAEDWSSRIQQLRQAVGSSDVCTLDSSTTPYCYVPRNAICPWLQECLPSRAYALRETSNSSTGGDSKHSKPRTGKQLIYKFNEVQEVLQRLARHVWPGPVTMHVAVPYAKEGSATATTGPSSKFQHLWSQLSTITTTPCPQQAPQEQQQEGSSSPSSYSCRFLTLRCPRHPLAIKASQQHHLATLRGSKLQRQDSNGQPTPTSNPSRQHENNPFSILVGFPIAGPQQQAQKQDVESYCCTAKQVQQLGPSGTNKISAVLDGEDHPELFSVPTCEYKEPLQTQIWIDGPNRTITVVQPSEQDQPQHRRASLFAASSNSSANGESCGSPRPTTSEARLRAALRQCVPTTQRLNAPREKLIQAVLCRWKIVMIQAAPKEGRT